VKFEEIVTKLRDNSGRLFQFLRRVNNEADVLVVLADVLGCHREISYKTDFSEMRVDLVCGDVAVEVEVDKRPYDGFHQVLAYKALLDFEKVVIMHVVRYAYGEYVEAFKKMLNVIRDENVRGVIISVEDGEVFAF